MNLETSLDAAEPELLALLRGEDATEFSLSIECRNDRWAVRCVTPGTEHSAIEGMAILSLRRGSIGIRSGRAVSLAVPDRYRFSSPR
jgi:hypothetical protein